MKKYEIFVQPLKIEWRSKIIPSFSTFFEIFWNNVIENFHFDNEIDVTANVHVIRYHFYSKIKSFFNRLRILFYINIYILYINWTDPVKCILHISITKLEKNYFYSFVWSIYHYHEKSFSRYNFHYTSIRNLFIHTTSFLQGNVN